MGGTDDVAEKCNGVDENTIGVMDDLDSILALRAPP